MSPQLQGALRNGAIGGAGGVIGAVIINMIGGGEGFNEYVVIPLAGFVGGAIGGWFKAGKG